MSITAESTDDEVRAYIVACYDDGPWDLGWSYIYGQPQSRRSPRIVTIGLNPGGGRDDRKWGDDAYLDQAHAPDIVNAYFDQPWGANGALNPLQQQFACLRSLNADIPLTDWLSFQFVPFRSPGWADLKAKGAAIALGTTLLPWTMATARPELIVGFGLGPVAGPLLAFLQADYAETCCTGWGRITAKVYRSPLFGRIVLLPHLSRYRILGRGRFADDERLLRVQGSSG